MESRLLNLLKGKAKYSELAKDFVSVRYLLMLSTDPSALGSDYERIIQVRSQARLAATIMLRLLQALPEQVGAPTAIEFVLGFSPLNPLDPNSEDGKLLTDWHRWMGSLYRLSLTPNIEQANEQKAGLFLKEFQSLVGELDVFVTSRVEFWERETQA